MLSTVKTSFQSASLKTILLVEDNESLADVVAAILSYHGYFVLLARGACEAIELARNYACPIDLLLTDVVMPQVSGIDLAGLLTVFRPGMKVLYMSGYMKEDLCQNALLEPGSDFLQKPASAQNITGKINELLKSNGCPQD